ncbi:glutaryl-CoA dehydrogenase [Absidia repens]|uniref:glutaryl-CoA dehydrogenase (ETF) n=1 Tax=Absidia repens TaxID=90262 RepID=A0A1X2IQK8_9FUNG|nr:glutaryl-CoA dehydrogenase [Absidia repens]
MLSPIQFSMRTLSVYHLTRALASKASIFVKCNWQKSQLTDDEIMVRQDFDRNIIQEMGVLGFLRSTIDGYDCAGIFSLSYGLTAREVEFVDSGYRSAMSVQSSLVIHPTYAYGTETQKEINGIKIGYFVLTEPDHGSVAGMETIAKKVDGHCVFNGSKTWITNSSIADDMIVWAKNLDEDGAIRGFILERVMADIETPTLQGKMSLRPTITGTLMLDNVQVPVANMLSNIEGINCPFRCLNNTLYGICWGSLGATDTWLTQAHDYTWNIINLMIKKKLADFNTETYIGLQACLQVVKRNPTIKALEISREAHDTLGGNGVSAEYNIIRQMNNLEIVVTSEETKDMHTLILGRSITGIPAFQ